jgi:hypothetical protein
MRPIVYLFSIVVTAGLVLSACNTGIFSEEVPGYPTFGLDVEQVDFGRVIMHEESRQPVTVRNVGALDSKLYLYYYLEGSSSYKLTSPEQEVTLTPHDGAYPIEVAFVPERNGELTANLVIYHSFRPLAEDTDVTTRRVALSGEGVFMCVFPGMTDPAPKPAALLSPIDSRQ